MHKKSIFAIISVTLAVVVASLALVFTVGPMVSADSVLIPTEYLNIHDGVLGYGSSAFTAEGQWYIKGLSAYRVEIPDGVTSIGDFAFDNCTKLTSITIPAGVTSIGEGAFYYCTSLTSITIPSSVTSIGVAAFCGCTNLTSVTIPDSVTSIGDWAFAVTGLTRANIGNGVKTIGDSAFSDCINITSITIPDSVTSIGDKAFEGCTSLTSVTIPDSVTSIGSRVFESCNNLTEIIVENPALMNDPNLAPYQSILHCTAQYTVTFETNSEDTVASQTVKHGATIELPDEPSKPGHNFVGWYRDAECTEPFNVESPITADVTLYAKWSFNQYHVTFMANGGSTVDAQTVDYNATVPEPDDPTRTGYTFDGWYTDAECTQAYDFGDAVTSNLTLYAKWEPEDRMVTFDINGTISSQTVKYGETVEAPAIPTQEGYTFIGWYTQDNVLFNFDAPITNDVNLHAVWGVNYFIVIFMDDGSVVDQQNVNFNSKVIKPSNPTQAGYVFAGWYLGDNEYDFDTPVTQNTTLTAKWNPIANENQINANHKNNNALMAWIGGGIAAGLGAIATVAGIVVARKRKSK